MPSGSPAEVEQTEVGSYFVANYPPFSVWTADAVASDARPALASAPAPGVPLGLYLHIPFCRKRCHFCYFRVYTDKNAQEIEDYLEVLVRELELYARLPAIAGRPLNFVYFGGGTPSFLSTRQLEGLVSRLTAITSWDDAEEITFECEPGTLTEAKLSADSVTIYQMEHPFNTAISSDLLKGTHRLDETLANWSTKRRWVKEAFE